MSDTPISDNNWFYQPSDRHVDKVVPFEVSQRVERENNQLRTKLVIAETTCDELSPLIEKNNQLREALKECASLLHCNCKFGIHCPICDTLYKPIVQQVLKTTKYNNT